MTRIQVTDENSLSSRRGDNDTEDGREFRCTKTAIANKLLLPADRSLARAQGSSRFPSTMECFGIRIQFVFRRRIILHLMLTKLRPSDGHSTRSPYVHLSRHPVKCSANHPTVFFFLLSFHAQAILNTATAINVPALK